MMTTTLTLVCVKLSPVARILKDSYRSGGRGVRRRGSGERRGERREGEEREGIVPYLQHQQ